MTLLQAALTQVQVWSAYQQLHRPDAALRWSAVKTLTSIGPAALPCLRFAIGAHHPPHVRFAAAVALHDLGDPRGLSTLTEALRTLPPDLPTMAAELTRAYITVGAPDAVTALIDIFPRLEWRDTHVLTCVCDVWATLRDPRALPVLMADGARFSDLFERTVPAFGEMAIPPLDRMAREQDPTRSLLAIRTLRHIRSPSSFIVLRGVLRSPVPALRSEACNALREISAPAAVRAVAEAVQEGFSTREAVDLILQGDIAPGMALSALIKRRGDLTVGPTGDTADAVIAALNYYAGQPDAADDLLPVFARMIARDPDPSIAAAAARILAVGPPLPANAADRLLEPLIVRLTDVNGPLREACGAALQRIGEPLGAQLNARITQAMPTEGLISRLQALLRGGPEAGQVATQTVQQVSQWVTRLSRDTVEKIGVSAGTTAREDPVDSRLPLLLRDLLRNALTALSLTVEPVPTGEMLGLSVAAIRVLTRLPATDAQCARGELIRAIHTVKRMRVRDWPAAEPSISVSRDVREVAEPLRTSAANLLVRCDGPDSCTVFIEALDSPAECVLHNAIGALSRLGDGRALPRLQRIASDVSHPERAAAAEAVAAIRRVNPEMMTLLRAAPTDSAPDSLLRPAYGNSNAAEPDKLLRAVVSETDSVSPRSESPPAMP